MKPSDSSERTRERKAKQRAMSRPGVTPQNDTTEGTIDAIPRRSMGRTPEESGYPEGQVDVRTGPQGQRLWRLNGCYRMDNRILCMKA